MARANTYADRVNIVKVVKVDGKWISAPVVERNGRIIRDHVLVKGKDEHPPPEGCYYLDWYDSGKKRRQAAPPPKHTLLPLDALFLGSCPSPSSWKLFASVNTPS